ncbi:MAG: NifU N-terminal domain-containing protein, partial [Candidatus Omnitrophota bacterium]
MPYTMTVQPTPNPNALKFVVNERIIKKGNITFKSQDEAQ